MATFRRWLFRSFILSAIGLMLVSWFLPWWSVNIPRLTISNAVVIRPYGLTIDEAMYTYKSSIEGVDMPGFFTPLMWAYLAICVIAVLLAAFFIKDKNIRIIKFNFNLPRLIIGFVGFSYIAIAVIAIVYSMMRAAAIDMSMFEPTLLQVYPTVYAEPGLQIGYWLAYGAGALLIVLALLRNRIIGETRT